MTYTILTITGPPVLSIEVYLLYDETSRTDETHIM